MLHGAAFLVTDTKLGVTLNYHWRVFETKLRLSRQNIFVATKPLSRQTRVCCDRSSVAKVCLCFVVFVARAVTDSVHRIFKHWGAGIEDS